MIKKSTFLKGDGYDLIGNPDHPGVTSTDNEYYCIHDDLFDRILETDQNSDVILKVIHKEPSFSSINVKKSNSISENNSMSEMVTPRHQLHRKCQKEVHDYSQKSIDFFKRIIVNPSPKLTDQEKKGVMNYFDSSSQNQFIETNTKRILNRVLRRCNEDKSIAHPSTCAFSTAETAALKIYSIELK